MLPAHATTVIAIKTAHVTATGAQMTRHAHVTQITVHRLGQTVGLHVRRFVLATRFAVVIKIVNVTAIIARAIIVVHVVRTLLAMDALGIMLQ